MKKKISITFTPALVKAMKKAGIKLDIKSVLKAKSLKDLKKIKKKSPFSFDIEE